MSEADTRAQYIDPALKSAGWGVVDGSRIWREHAITKGRLQCGGKRACAEIASAQELGNKQQAFVEFVLGQYVEQGVDELDLEKLAPLPKLRYRGGPSDAFADLEQVEQVRGVFVGFQRRLYLQEN